MKNKKPSEPKKRLMSIQKVVASLAPPPPPSLLPSDPEAVRKRNEKWFNVLNETVGTIAVVPPPLAGPPITVIPGFTVPCICKTPPMYQGSTLPRPVCEKCGGKGFVVIEKG